MKATAELQVIPIGQSVSVREEIKTVIQLLQQYDLTVQTHASGTNLEGDLEEILSATRAIHALLHEQGCVRLVSYLKLETRTDKIPTLAGKRLD